MNEIFALLRQVLIAGFAEQGMTVRVMQSYAGVSSGPPSVPAIIMHHITPEKVGWQSRKAEVIDDTAVIVSKQNYAETVQFNAVMPFVAPEDEDAATMLAFDLLTMAAMILQGPLMLSALKAAGMGMQSIKTVSTNRIQNEKEQWEDVPSFDLVICHKLTMTNTVGKVEQITSGIYRV